MEWVFNGMKRMREAEMESMDNYFKKRVQNRGTRKIELARDT